jgi:hypothetical protein
MTVSTTYPNQPRRHYLISNILILAVTVFYLVNVYNGHDWGGDFAMYIHHAANLVSGVPYAQTGYIYNPDAANYGPQAYPPVFPLMLAPFVAIFGVNLLVLKIPGILCFSTFLLYLNNRVIKQDLPELFRILLIGLIGFSPAFFDQSESILSDIPFLLFTIVALYRMDMVFSAQSPRSPGWNSTLLTGLFIYLSYGCRTIGIILLPVLFVLYLFQRKNNGRSFLIILTTAVLLILLQRVLIPGTGSYFDQFPGSLSQFAAILSILLNNYLTLTLQLVPVASDAAQKVAFLIMFIFFLSGLYFRLKNGVTAFDLFFMAYFAALLIWPSYQGYRFLLPIIPLYFLYAVEGLNSILNLICYSSLFQKAIPSICIGLIALSYIYAYQGVFPRPLSAMEQPETRELFEYVKNETTPDDVIVFFKPRVLALFTGRSSVAIAIANNGIDPIKRMRQFGVDWVIVREGHSDEYQPEQSHLINQHPDLFTPVKTIGDFAIYRFH